MLCAWCFQFCTTSTLTFGRFSEVGLLAILTDVFVEKPCKRPYLCSKWSEEMVIELHYHIRLPSHLSHPLGVQFAHFLVPEVLVYLLPTCCCERAHAGVNKFFVARHLFPVPLRSRVKGELI